MKKSKFMQQTWEELGSYEREVLVFFQMCGRKNIGFFEHRRNRTVSDYARIMTIARIFGFTGLCMRIMIDGKKRVDSILQEIDNVNHNFDVVKAWCEEFIENIPDQTLKNLCKEYWTDITKDIDPKNFSVKNLFGRSISL